MRHEKTVSESRFGALWEPWEVDEIGRKTQFNQEQKNPAQPGNKFSSKNLILNWRIAKIKCRYVVGIGSMNKKGC